MMSLLELVVKCHVVSSRQVCDALLYSDHLRYEKADFWVSALKLVRKIIGKIFVDLKSDSALLSNKSHNFFKC